MKNNMQMTDFQEFLFVNNLKSVEAAKILGVSNPFVTFLKKGQARLSDRQLEILKENKFDTSMLEKKPVLRNNNGNNNYVENIEGDVHFGEHNENSHSYSELINIINELTDQLKTKDGQIQYCRQHIDRLVSLMDNQNNTIVILNNLISEAKKQVQSVNSEDNENK